jgi:hypothetical protein
MSDADWNDGPKDETAPPPPPATVKVKCVSHNGPSIGRDTHLGLKFGEVVELPADVAKLLLDKKLVEAA